MNAKRKPFLIGIIVLILSTGSCNLGAPPVPTSDISAALTLQALVQTVTAQAATTAVEAPTTLSTQDFPTATELPPATAVPIVFTPTFILVPTPTIPMVSVTTGTNCRSGPGVAYDILGGAPVGIKFVLIGKSTLTNYWIIRLQDGRECWLWGQYAVVEGNINTLPEYIIPPTPIPPVGSIAGVISDYGGTLLSNVTVTAQLAERSVLTDSVGRYSFDNLPVRTEYITVEASDYQPDFRSVTIMKGQAVKEDFQLAGLSIPSGDVPYFEGRVLLNGNPIAGVTVWLWSTYAQTVTDGNGRYQLGALLSKDHALILASMGNWHGAVDVPILQKQTTAPDLILISR